MSKRILVTAVIYNNETDEIEKTFIKEIGTTYGYETMRTLDEFVGKLVKHTCPSYED